MGIYICAWLRCNQDEKYAEKVENKRIAICEVLANLDFLVVYFLYKEWPISIHETLANLDRDMMHLLMQWLHFNPRGSREPRRQTSPNIRCLHNTFYKNQTKFKALFPLPANFTPHFSQILVRTLHRIHVYFGFAQLPIQHFFCVSALLFIIL